MEVNYNKLWKLMIDKGINKTQLRLQAGINTNALDTLGKHEMAQMEVLIRICKVLNCKIDDIVDYSYGKEALNGNN